jgi:hypothetical protein
MSCDIFEGGEREKIKKGEIAKMKAKRRAHLSSQSLRGQSEPQRISDLKSPSNIVTFQT